MRSGDEWSFRRARGLLLLDSVGHRLVMTNIVLGATNKGGPGTIDLEELLASRLLVQGNSGSGKSHLLRRLLEQSAGRVQQIVIGPEGDFVSLSERFGHVTIDGASYGEAEIAAVTA